MAIRDEESQKVMAAAMRYVKDSNRSELESFPLAILKKADYQLSDRDASSGYRRAIKDLITELEQNGSLAGQADVIDIKPNFYGLGVNFNEAWRRIRTWWAKK